jgi:hypothetical protein
MAADGSHATVMLAASRQDKILFFIKTPPDVYVPVIVIFMFYPLPSL